MSENESEEWKGAMDEELQKIEKMNTWDPELYPEGRRISQRRWSLIASRNPLEIPQGIELDLSRRVSDKNLE